MIAIPEDLKNIALITPNIPAAVVCPDQESVLLAINEANKIGLLDPILVGKKKSIEQVASKIDLNIQNYNIVDTSNEQESASVACQMASEGRSKIIVKGNLHTDILMRFYLKKEFNLLQGKRLSHIWHMTASQLKKPIYITDGALNVLPRVEIKLQILKNAVEFYNKVNSNKPNVAILSGTEDPIESMPSSVDAKKVMELSKEENINAFIHGPLAFDNAVSKKAAEIKNIENEVAGNADILLVPNLETGNSLSKMMVYFMNACAAGIVIGGKTPIVVPSRADSMNSKLASIMAAIVASEN
jgi:phosphate acetyltransferase